MPDRVRAAIFDMLGSHYDCPGALPGLAVADVFAGSGSMGLEALSRGAALCYFFERDRSALAALQANVDALSVGRRAVIVQGDAWRRAVSYAGRLSPDIVLLDPPYAESEDTSEDGAVRRFMHNLDSAVDTAPVLVLHHHHKVRYVEADGDPWMIVKQRTFGSNTVTFFAQ